MSEFVKLTNKTKINLIGLDLDKDAIYKVNNTYTALLVSTTSAAITTNNTDTISTSIIQPNQNFHIYLGTLSPKKYSVLLVFSINFIEVVKNYPPASIIDKGEMIQLFFSFQAKKKIDLKEVGPIIKLYLLI